MSSQQSSQTLKRSFQSTEDESSQSSRPRKRPGGASRISTVDKEAVLKRQQEREEEAKKAVATRGVHDVVRQHYNAVPQRGRDWRKTDSRIKGLRSFNNWIKSTIIHKFSPTEQRTSQANGHEESPGILVLDLGCGKGGDLGKWQQAPQAVNLLVGVDPAEVSIEQARERYTEMARRGGRGGRGGFRGGREKETFHAEFFAQDAFGKSIANIPIIREVGFDTGAPGSRRGAGGFDVVSMMFCMHYAFESEAKTRGMLQNVAGSLKKGGRFLGTIPNSDAIRSRVEAFHRTQEKLDELKERHDSKKSPENSVSKKKSNELTSKQTAVNKDDVQPISKEIAATQGDPQLKTKPNISEERDTGSTMGLAATVESNPEIPGEKSLQTESIKKSLPNEQLERNPLHTTNISQNSTSIAPNGDEPEPPKVAEWGNDIYRVRFPGSTPKDGIFRPPFGWKYSYFMEEAVEEIPEYVVPWEAFRAYVPRLAKPLSYSFKRN